MEVQMLLLDSLDYRWETYKTELKKCRQEFSEEAVHDFRVSVRRLLSFLDLLRVIQPNPKIRRTRRVLKDQLDDLDDLRNIQVLLADISENIHDIPALKSFQKHLQKKEKKLLRLARREIKSLRTVNLTKRVQRIRKSLKTLEQVDVETSLFAAIDEIFASVNQRYLLIDPEKPFTIHRLRIAFKKFRYMIEVIFPALQHTPLDFLKKLQEHQSTLGDIQDLEVALQELADFYESGSGSHNSQRIRAYYQERHASVISRYIEEKGELLKFWRPSPNEPFPKEK